MNNHVRRLGQSALPIVASVLLFVGLGALISRWTITAYAEGLVYSPPSNYRLFELKSDTWDTRSNYPTEYVAWHLSLDRQQEIELAYSYNYSDECTHYYGNLKLMRADSEEGTQVWSEVFLPSLFPDGTIYYEKLNLDAGDYYLLGTLSNSHSDTYYSSFSVKYEISSASEAPDTKPEQQQTVQMHRLYNQWTGEHFYTADTNEKNSLVSVGWTYEGIGWTALWQSGDPVYRLYNPYVPGGDHHYTMSAEEYYTLSQLGWRMEGVAWGSAPKDSGVPLYRQYNPYASTGTHNYTASKEENDHLVSVGWREEGIAWYGVK